MTRPPPPWVPEGLELYRAGTPYQAIAARFRLALPTVWKALKRHGCVSRSRQVFTEAMAQQGLVMYAKGLSYGDVAEYFGCTRNGAYYALKSRGCVSRPQLRFGRDNHFHRGGGTMDERAHNLVEKAIERGILIPAPCEQCGADGVFKDGRREVQAHHCDYNHPLDVKWLCQTCHHLWHASNHAIPVKA